jgi:hypothetical protein
MSWLDDAACRDHDPAMWFSQQVLPAIRVCNECPVRRECLSDADASESQLREETFGVRGGLTARERIKRRSWLRRNRLQGASRRMTA